ncbi:MAG TPA: peptidylprolyl isomerase [Thermodesulfovibrionales bacterium]|nr:peptidylprolyl isomerase [Thermodesulfovibrionales bacterium]
MTLKGYSEKSHRSEVMMVISLVVVCISPALSYPAALLDKIVAVVNKDVITWGELYRTMEFEATNEMKALSDAEKNKVFKENESAFLERMIDMKLQLQLAKKLDIDASKDEVAEAIEGIRKKYAMDDTEFQRSLKKEGFTLEEYKKRLSEQIILNKVVNQQVKNKIVISEEEISNYMAKNQGTEYKVRQIFFRKTDKDFDREAMEAKAGEVLQRLQNGESFASLAQKYSDDPTARTGGDLGFIKQEYLGKEFLNVLSAMSVGSVSSPFWTEKGLHIIYLEEKVDAKNAAEFREIAMRKLMEKRFNEEYKTWIRGLRERAFVEVRL